MKTWGSRDIAPPFLTSALDGGEWSASRPCRLNPGKGAACTHWIGGWVGPRVNLNSDCTQLYIEALVVWRIARGQFIYSSISHNKKVILFESDCVHELCV
jgi:hypothetical protein